MRYLALSLFLFCSTGSFLYSQDTQPKDEGIAVYIRVGTYPNGTKEVMFIDSVWMKGSRSKCKTTSYHCLDYLESYADYDSLKYYHNFINVSTGDTVSIEDLIEPIESGTPTIYSNHTAIFIDKSDENYTQKSYYATDTQVKGIPVGDRNGFLLYSYFSDSINIMGIRETILISLKYCSVSEKDLSFDTKRPKSFDIPSCSTRR